jgi:uncharacterized membrane protein YjjP (DUF1212 family)
MGQRRYPLPGDSALGIGEKPLRPLSGKQPLSYEALGDIIDLALWSGQILLQHGASSERVEETVHRIGTGLGCNWMDIDVGLEALTITAISGEDFRTKIRRIVRSSVNFQIVAEVNDLGHKVSEGRLNRQQVRAMLIEIEGRPPAYGSTLTTLAVMLALAGFSQLLGGDWVAFAATLVGGGVGMIVRQTLAHRYFNPYIIVVASAFAASLTAAAVDLWQLTTTPGVAMIAAVLFLVPGVPLINAAQDLMRGYTTNGIARGVEGLIISMAIAIGLFFALGLVGLQLP